MVTIIRAYKDMKMGPFIKKDYFKTSGFWELFFAKLFGLKTVFTGEGITITSYRFRDRVYIVKINQ